MKDWILHHLGNEHDRAAIMTLISFALNAIFCLVKLVLGVYLHSAWFMINAGYYFLLCFARGYTVHKYTVTREVGNAQARYDMEFSLYKRGGFFICLLGLSYLLVCLRMYFLKDATVYSGHLVYFVALVAFCKMGFAIHGMIIHRHMKSPIIAALKAYNIADALVSIVVTQCTLLTMEGLVEEATRFSALTGIAFSAIMLLQGILMLVKRKKLQAEPSDDLGDQMVEDVKKTIGINEHAIYQNDMNSCVQIR